MGVSALALAACEDPNALIPAKAYENVAACVEDGFSQAQCNASFVAAENAYEKAYPKYDSQAECEVNAGPEKCELDHPSSRSGNWRPTMIGFLMGAAAASRIEPQPIVPSASSPTGRATATGQAIGRGTNGNIPVRAAAAPTATQVAKSHTLARGGFGSTASKVAATPSAAASGTRSSGG
jgi:uncharacterized protein YgiB involved in biofilm formation